MQANTEKDLNVKRNPAAVVERLKKEAVDNPIFSALCHFLGSRDRTRSQMTIAAVRLSMAREGYHFQRVDYERIFKFLANLGIGTLEFDKGAQLQALVNINYTLQSVGMVAVTDALKLEAFTPSAPPKAPAVRQTTVAKPTPVVAKILAKEPEAYTTSLVVNIDGQAISFPLPHGLTTAEIGLLLAQVFSGKTHRSQ